MSLAPREGQGAHQAMDQVGRPQSGGQARQQRNAAAGVFHELKVKTLNSKNGAGTGAADPVNSELED
jgi:hypothetical protein